MTIRPFLIRTFPYKAVPFKTIYLICTLFCNVDSVYSPFQLQLGKVMFGVALGVL